MDIVVVVQGQTNLLQIIPTLRAACCLAGLLHRRKKQCDQNCDDGNHHQQFN